VIDDSGALSSGQVLANVMISKTLYSLGRSAGVQAHRVQEAAGGRGWYTTNEPAQLCLLSANEPAVGYLLARRIERRLWQVVWVRGRPRLPWIST